MNLLKKLYISSEFFNLVTNSPFNAYIYIGCFFNETFDYSETIYIVDETNQLYSQFQKDFNNLLRGTVWVNFGMIK